MDSRRFLRSSHPAFAAKYAHKLHAILLFQGFVFYTGIKPESSRLHRAQLAALLCFYEKNK
jgi:hypothetical protein